MNGDRKRTLPESTDLPSKKAKPLQELSSSGPLTQDDVVYFQKEAIWRQMIQYKQQVVSLRLEVIRLQRESSSLKHVVTVLTAWYEQIVSLFDEIDRQESNDLLVAFEKNVDDKLKGLKSKLSGLISNKVTFDDAKYAKVSGEFAVVSRENQQLQAEKTSLSEKIDELESQIEELIKERERSESKTLKRIDGSRPEPEKPEPEANGFHQETTTATTSTATPPQIDSEELDRLKSEVEQLKSANKLLMEQVEQLTKENQSLILQAVNLEKKLHNLEESDLQDNIFYKKIVKNNQSLQQQISNVTKLNSSNASKLNELEKQQNDLKNLILSEILEENEKLKQQLHESENNLVRIRTARDELLAKNTILSSQLQDEKTNESLIKLNEELSKRIEQLTNDKLDSIVGSPSEDKLKELSQQELIQKIGQLNEEIKEVELAFKQTREITLKKLNSSIDQENLTKKLAIEKNKADQKYFAAMRSKDSLSNENKLLKIQIAKSQDLIKNLNELEKKYLSKIEILGNQLVDFKVIKENSLLENSKLQEDLRSVTIAHDTLQQELDRVNEKLESSLKEYTQLQDLNKKQEIELTKVFKQLKTTEDILQKYKSNNTNSLLQEDEQQLEALRSIAKCSVCTQNWKDTVITVCGHVFCSKCTSERLQARLRRCPTCNKGFSGNDLLAVHL
ncbi:E3 ubiquitin-protein ligase BRE1 [Candida viswanathii]|uniref:E3 ubiquitin protein ligase n=1 Tax=Candida viswanathii TaxID=5486 RepID=A0A367YIJ2_9ASCO|nr:E3 ubiquitin-protein ligase BRE1 [Candida viswanathii]